MRPTPTHCTVCGTPRASGVAWSHSSGYCKVCMRAKVLSYYYANKAAGTLKARKAGPCRPRKPRSVSPRKVVGVDRIKAAMARIGWNGRSEVVE